jgi:hypothetical protein
MHLREPGLTAIAAAVTVAFMTLASLEASGSDDVVRMRVTQPDPDLPGQVRVVVSVEPDDENRALVVEADSGTFFRSSEFTLEGSEAARTHRIDWRQLPAGEYRVAAYLRRSSGKRTFASYFYLKVLGLDATKHANVLDPFDLTKR